MILAVWQIFELYLLLNAGKNSGLKSSILPMNFDQILQDAK